MSDALADGKPYRREDICRDEAFRLVAAGSWRGCHCSRAGPITLRLPFPERSLGVKASVKWVARLSYTAERESGLWPSSGRGPVAGEGDEK